MTISELKHGFIEKSSTDELVELMSDLLQKYDFHQVCLLIHILIYCNNDNNNNVDDE